MKRIVSILMIIVLMCLCILAWVSVFVWHNTAATIVFAAGLFVWLWTLEAENN